ncbi:MAG TPA: dinitrogenase iron-molybdenum cofactor biosynthesis protein [Dehalococcoidia bacterium]|nr:dinitrogenase iron-molybdenum cofactor biosynthesis protein [Dehalococcoidia bacterium]
MKIAITATGTTLENDVDSRFGRCPYFIIADPDTMEYEYLDNASAQAGGGAGIAAAQMIVEKGVESVLTGNCGPNAYNVLSPAGIKVITGVSGRIADVIEDYKEGRYKESAEANVSSHHGKS